MQNVMNFTKSALLYVLCFVVFFVYMQAQTIATAEIAWPSSVYFDALRALGNLLFKG